MEANQPLELPADRPALLLGVDGVINVFQCSLARETIVAPHLPALMLLPGLPEWLAMLDQAYSIVWCSLWGAPALHEAARAWGLGPRPLVQPTPAEAAQPEWQALAVRRSFAGWPGALAWVDESFGEGARAWAAERLRAGRRTWLVDVRETGLTAEITDLLLEWVA